MTSEVYMSHQDFQVAVTYISRADLESLILRFAQARAEADSEIIYFEGVKDHQASNEDGFRHTLKTMIKRNGQGTVWGTLTLVSVDNEIFTGTFKYTKTNGR